MSLTRQKAVNLTYKNDGTGAVVRTIKDKLGETVSVKDFGAVGDGVTDDAAAIQAAIDSGAGVIVFPTATYNITAPIVVGKEVILQGNKSTLSKSTTTTYAGVDSILHLHDDTLLNDLGVHGFKLQATASSPYTATGIYCIATQTDNDFSDLKIQSVKHGIYFGGGYQLTLKQILVNACWSGITIDADLTAGASNMTSIYGTQISVSNCGRGIYLNKVKYSALEGYVFGVTTTASDLYTTNEVPVALRLEQSSGIDLKYGGEAIEGCFLYSSASYGTLNAFLTAGAGDQYIPDATRTSNGFTTIDEQAYFTLKSSSWIVSGSQITLGDASWTTPADRTTLAYLDTAGYLKFLAGSVSVNTGKMTVAKGVNSGYGLTSENTRNFGNWQDLGSNNVRNLGNGYGVYSASQYFSSPTPEVTITFSEPFDQVWFGAATVQRASSAIIGAQIKAISTTSITFIFEADVNGYSVHFFVFGQLATA